jgi:AraC-like DNA-binding protein
MQRSTGTSRVTNVWQGRDGYDRFRERYAYATSDPSAFDASLGVVAVDGVLIAEWRTTPVSGTGYRPGEAHSAMLISVSEGSVRYAVEGRVVEGLPGSTHLLSTLEGVRFTIPERSRFLLVMVPEALMREAQRAVTARSVGPVDSTGVTATLAALVEDVLDPERGGTGSPAARTVRSLALAAIEDSVPDTPDLGLRDRILEHIERHLDDVALGPQPIADHFGISLRWVHHVFNIDGRTVARHIRERRLDTAAAILRSDLRFPRLGSLAERTGFSNKDRLTRAFKGRYGVTVGDYAELAAKGGAPEPLDPADDETGTG